MLLTLGKRREFDRVVRAYSADLYRFAYWLCRDNFVAEDLVQETFARAWRNWAQLRDPSAPKPWLLTILRNEHARLYERKRLEMVDTPPEDLSIAAEGDALELMALEQVIGRLPDSLREPFLLQCLGGFSCAEIAEQLDTTEGAVMVRLTRARQALRGLLEPGAAHTQRGSA
jgi:RNA polymerase sigma-70 factor (ECF subfamily)